MLAGLVVIIIFTLLATGVLLRMRTPKKEFEASIFHSTAFWVYTGNWIKVLMAFVRIPIAHFSLLHPDTVTLTFNITGCMLVSMSTISPAQLYAHYRTQQGQFTHIRNSNRLKQCASTVAIYLGLFTITYISIGTEMTSVTMALFVWRVWYFASMSIEMFFLAGCLTHVSRALNRSDGAKGTRSSSKIKKAAVQLKNLLLITIYMRVGIAVTILLKLFKVTNPDIQLCLHMFFVFTGFLLFDLHKRFSVGDPTTPTPTTAATMNSGSMSFSSSPSLSIPRFSVMMDAAGRPMQLVRAFTSLSDRTPPTPSSNQSHHHHHHHHHHHGHGLKRIRVPSRTSSSLSLTSFPSPNRDGVQAMRRSHIDRTRQFSRDSESQNIDDEENSNSNNNINKSCNMPTSSSGNLSFNSTTTNSTTNKANKMSRGLEFDDIQEYGFELDHGNTLDNTDTIAPESESDKSDQTCVVQPSDGNEIASQLDSAVNSSSNLPLEPPTQSQTQTQTQTQTVARQHDIANIFHEILALGTSRKNSNNSNNSTNNNDHNFFTDDDDNDTKNHHHHHHHHLPFNLGHDDDVDCDFDTRKTRSPALLGNNRPSSYSSPSRGPSPFSSPARIVAAVSHALSFRKSSSNNNNNSSNSNTPVIMPSLCDDFVAEDLHNRHHTTPQASTSAAESTSPLLLSLPPAYEQVSFTLLSFSSCVPEATTTSTITTMTTPTTPPPTTQTQTTTQTTPTTPTTTPPTTTPATTTPPTTTTTPTQQ